MILFQYAIVEYHFALGTFIADSTHCLKSVHDSHFAELKLSPALFINEPTQA
jgi:hypothetical protein